MYSSALLTPKSINDSSKVNTLIGVWYGGYNMNRLYRATSDGKLQSIGRANQQTNFNDENLQYTNIASLPSFTKYNLNQ